MTHPIILVDDRAGSRDLVEYPPLNECGQLCRLPSGDACITGNGPRGDILIGVEVKSVFDLISSADTGRLQGVTTGQLPRMLKDYDVSWLLYYGTYRPGFDPRQELQLRKGKGWRNHRVGTRSVPYGFLESLVIGLTDAGINVKHVVDPTPRKLGGNDKRVVAAWLGVLARRYHKQWSDHDTFKKFNTSQALALPTVDDFTRILAGFAKEFTSIGYKRAMSVARQFDSVHEMMNAGIQRWAEIEVVSAKGRSKRLGPTIAHAVVDTIRRKRDEDESSTVTTTIAAVKVATKAATKAATKTATKATTNPRSVPKS